MTAWRGRRHHCRRLGGGASTEEAGPGEGCGPYAPAWAVRSGRKQEVGTSYLSPVFPFLSYSELLQNGYTVKKKKSPSTYLEVFRAGQTLLFH